MAKIKFRYVKRIRDKDGKEKNNQLISNGAILDALSDLQNMCDAGGFKMKYYLKPNKDILQEEGKIWVSVRRTTRDVQRPTKMMIAKVVLHKLEDFLELRWK